MMKTTKYFFIQYIRILRIILSVLFLGFSSSLANAQSIVYPRNSQVISDTNITILWDNIINYDSYHIQISEDSLFQTLLIDSNNLSETEFLPIDQYYPLRFLHNRTSDKVLFLRSFFAISFRLGL